MLIVRSLCAECLFPALTPDRGVARKPFNHDRVIKEFQELIRSMSRANQYLLLYVLDLLSVFARKSDKNRMTATSKRSPSPAYPI